MANPVMKEKLRIGAMIRRSLNKIYKLSEKIDSGKAHIGNLIRVRVRAMDTQVPALVGAANSEKLTLLAKDVSMAIKDLEDTELGKRFEKKVELMKDRIILIENSLIPKILVIEKEPEESEK